MQYWLIKSEPFKYSWQQLLKDKETFWDGVRNFQARNHLKQMKKGDMVFFYHSNEGLEIVGIASVSKEAYQDPTTNETQWVVVNIKPEKPLENPVSLSVIKQTPELQQMAFIKQPRLSVSPVTLQEWKIILKIAKTK